MCATYLLKKKTKKKTLVQSQAAARHDSLCQLSSPARSFSPRLLLSGSLVSQSPHPPPPPTELYNSQSSALHSRTQIKTHSNTTPSVQVVAAIYIRGGDHWWFPVAKLWCGTSQTWLTHMVLGRMWKSICCWCRDDSRWAAWGGKALKAAFFSLIHSPIVSTIFQQPSAASQSSPPFPYSTLLVNEVNGS